MRPYWHPPHSARSSSRLLRSLHRSTHGVPVVGVLLVVRPREAGISGGQAHHLPCAGSQLHRLRGGLVAVHCSDVCRWLPPLCSCHAVRTWCAEWRWHTHSTSTQRRTKYYASSHDRLHRLSHPPQSILSRPPPLTLSSPLHPPASPPLPTLTITPPSATSLTISATVDSLNRVPSLRCSRRTVRRRSVYWTTDPSVAGRRHRYGWWSEWERMVNECGYCDMKVSPAHSVSAVKFNHNSRP